MPAHCKDLCFSVGCALLLSGCVVSKKPWAFPGGVSSVHRRQHRLRAYCAHPGKKLESLIRDASQGGSSIFLNSNNSASQFTHGCLKVEWVNQHHFLWCSLSLEESTLFCLWRDPCPWGSVRRRDADSYGPWNGEVIKLQRGLRAEAEEQGVIGKLSWKR